MKVLVIGRGGREHAIVWKISQNPKVKKIYCSTGNAGISEIAECIDIKAENVKELAKFAKKNKIDLTVVGGPEIAFEKGIVEEFIKKDLKIFGCTQKAAQLEISRAFAKSIMSKYKIPSSKYGVFKDQNEAFKYIEKNSPPYIIKADGQCAGRGQIIAKDEITAKVAVNVLMQDKLFGEAGSNIIIEESLKGELISVIGFTDGKNVTALSSSAKIVRAYDGNRGPSTGGIGAYSKILTLTPKMGERIKKEIIFPLVKGMKKEGAEYRGVLYTSIMLTNKGPKVVDFDVRFGDPETQVILPRLKTDLVDIMFAVIDQKLDKIKVEWDDRVALCVSVVSGGYPVRYSTGYEIQGIEKMSNDIIVFHAGTSCRSGKYITNGGRIFNIVALKDNFKEASERIYEEINKLYFKDIHYRKDIGEIINRKLGKKGGK